jgi:hypothetical protein
MAPSAPNDDSTWTVTPAHAGACQVHDAHGLHVGNLKWIAGQWKFKAIGYDAQGLLVPGGGPLTDRHNTVFATTDAAAVQRALDGPGPPPA